jgi:hypothetical protein
MKISMTGKTIYTNIAIYDSFSRPVVWTNLNSVNKNGYYFQLTGTGIQTWTGNSYEDTDGTLTALHDRAHGENGSILIDLEDKNQNPMAVYRNKFTEISFDVSFTALNNTHGDYLHVSITDGSNDLFNVEMKSYVHYQFINFYHEGEGPAGQWEYLVSTDKLLYNNKNLITADTYNPVGHSTTTTAANNLTGTFFNIKIVFNDDEWALYFDNQIVKTNIAFVDKGNNTIMTGKGVNKEIKRNLGSTFKNYVNNSSYNRLKIQYHCGASYARCHIKNIQIKSGFGCHICT